MTHSIANVCVTYDQVQATTDEAVCLQVEGEDVWIPRDVIEDRGADIEVGFTPGEVWVEEPFAYREGLA